MPLTHVCMWQDNKWKRVDAEEVATQLSRTISARSGIFMCELCGQFVTLAGGDYQRYHFRHSAKEQNKECEDRSIIYDSVGLLRAENHDLPIKLKIISRQEFALEIGLIALPAGFLDKKTQIIIKGDNEAKAQIYSSSRLFETGITYLGLGRTPAKKYHITTVPIKAGLAAFWPVAIDGFSETGILFDAITNKKLPYDADVVVNHDYYIVSRRTILGYTPVEKQEICCMNIGWNSWRVYKIRAKEYSEETAKFFLKYHCRLTDEPVTMQPVWPVYQESPYIIKHNASEMYVYFQGNADISIAPKGSIRRFPPKSPQMLIINSKDRQQVLSAGRTNVLQYLYLWHCDIDAGFNSENKILVTDIQGTVLDKWEYYALPQKNQIRITSDVDGCVDIEEDKTIISRYDIKAGITSTIDNLKFGHIVKIYHGCDKVYELTFIREDNTENIGNALLNRIINSKGNEIPVNHSFGGIVDKLPNNRILKKWVYEAIRKGSAPAEAVKLIKSMVLNGRIR